MRTEKNREVSARRLEREANIMAMFAENKNKELTVEDAYETYHKTWPEDKSMDPNLISVMMKDMYGNGFLHRERRTVKRNRSGRIETVSIFFYKPSKDFNIVSEEMKKLHDEKPDLDFIPNEMQNRIAFKDSEMTTLQKVEKDTEEMKMVDELEHTMKKVREDNRIKQLDDALKNAKEKSVADMLTSLTFQEAFDKIYREGARVVSAVTGYIYAMVDEEKRKGIVCSANPNMIISRPSMEEMNGTWRELEPPTTCPFCGSKVKFVEDANSKRMYYMCTSGDCCARGPYATTPEEAVNKFNKRV